MRVGDRSYRSIWLDDDGWSVRIIDQTALPHEFVTVRLTTSTETADAIRAMRVRGAPLIGVTAAFGLALAMRADPSDAELDRASAELAATRPTAVNLGWALDRSVRVLRAVAPAERAALALQAARQLAVDDAAVCRQIGGVGLPIIAELHRRSERSINVLTHCNAGWLATVDWGTALAPIYLAHDAGLPVHVWVDETRPRNQGLLTAWELAQHGVPHTVVVDNAGGLLMRQGKIDVVIVGTDRVAANGDMANKVGTYLKALAAHDCGVPFYVAAPSSSIDWQAPDGEAIPIEARSPAELGHDASVPVYNPGFDVTPARLITGFLTERGLALPTASGLKTLFPAQE